MRNKILFRAALIAFCAFSMNISAQLEVQTSGDVKISQNLSVGTNVSSDTRLRIYGAYGSGIQYGINTQLIFGTIGWNAWKYAIKGYSKSLDGNCVGVLGEALPAATNRSVSLYGIYGIAGNGNLGKNYGVFGELQAGNQNGAGIYGTNDGTQEPLSSRYAGYFRGLTYVNGDFSSLTSNLTSDARLKRNITDIRSDAVFKIKDLHPVQYQWQQVEDVVTVDTITIKTPHFSKDVDLEKKHYGLLAQDVQKLFPELVTEGGDGYLSINYVELIPLLIQAVQDLSTEVEELKAQIK